jgi:CHAT domain-containing protein
VDSVSTQALMTNTFRNIQKGEPVLSAMSEAQRGISSGDFAAAPYRISRSHPFFWAPFVYVGD